MNQELVDISIEFHGAKLVDCLAVEQIEVGLPNFLALAESGKALESPRDDAFQQTISQFIAKKADLLFGFQDTIPPRINRQTSDDLFGVLPPLESFMQIPQKARLHHWYRTVKRGHILIGRVTSIQENGLVVSVVAMDYGMTRDLEGLAINAFCPLREIPKYNTYQTYQNVLDGYNMQDMVRGVVMNVIPEESRVFISLQSKALPTTLDNVILGVIQDEDIPLAYRRQTEVGSKSYNDQLRAVGFSNPASVDNMTSLLDLPEHPSLMRGLHGVKYPESEHAEKLRKSQSFRFAIKSVADGVEKFKEGKHAEAMQYLNKALQVDEENVEALVARGAIYANNESYSRAIEDLELAVKLNPSHKNACTYLCETLVAQGAGEMGDDSRVGFAIKCFERALELNSSRDDVRSLLHKLKSRDADVKGQRSTSPGSVSDGMLDKTAIQKSSDMLRKIMAEEDGHRHRKRHSREFDSKARHSLRSPEEDRYEDWEDTDDSEKRYSAERSKKRRRSNKTEEVVGHAKGSGKTKPVPKSDFEWSGLSEQRAESSFSDSRIVKSEEKISESRSVKLSGSLFSNSVLKDAKQIGREVNPTEIRQVIASEIGEKRTVWSEVEGGRKSKKDLSKEEALVNLLKMLPKDGFAHLQKVYEMVNMGQDVEGIIKELQKSGAPMLPKGKRTRSESASPSGSSKAREEAKLSVGRVEKRLSGSAAVHSQPYSKLPKMKSRWDSSSPESDSVTPSRKHSKKLKTGVSETKKRRSRHESGFSDSRSSSRSPSTSKKSSHKKKKKKKKKTKGSSKHETPTKNPQNVSKEVTGTETNKEPADSPLSPREEIRRGLGKNKRLYLPGDSSPEMYTEKEEAEVIQPTAELSPLSRARANAKKFEDAVLGKGLSVASKWEDESSNKAAEATMTVEDKERNAMVANAQNAYRIAVGSLNKNVRLSGVPFGVPPPTVSSVETSSKKLNRNRFKKNYSQERSNSRDRGRSSSGDCSRSRERSLDRSRGRSRGKNRGRSQETSRGRSQERNRGRSQERNRGRSQERNRGRSQERSRGRSQERGRGWSRERSRGKSQERSRGKSQERSRGRSQERNRGRSRDSSLNRSLSRDEFRMREDRGDFDRGRGGRGVGRGKRGKGFRGKGFKRGRGRGNNSDRGKGFDHGVNRGRGLYNNKVWVRGGANVTPNKTEDRSKFGTWFHPSRGRGLLSKSANPQSPDHSSDAGPKTDDKDIVSFYENLKKNAKK